MIWCNFLSILVPVLIVGNSKNGNNTITLIKRSYSICTAVIQPIRLQYEIVAMKLVKKKLLGRKDVKMAPNFEEVVMKIRCIEEEILRHTRLQLGLETIFGSSGL